MRVIVQHSIFNLDSNYSLAILFPKSLVFIINRCSGLNLNKSPAANNIENQFINVKNDQWTGISIADQTELTLTLKLSSSNINLRWWILWVQENPWSKKCILTRRWRETEREREKVGKTCKMNVYLSHFLAPKKSLLVRLFGTTRRIHLADTHT